MLLRVGIINVNPSGASPGGAGIANLNLTAIYAFAALTGLFARTATDKLSEVFSTAFQSKGPPSKDPLSLETPPGGAASSSQKSS
jgi:hypothetical protein